MPLLLLLQPVDIKVKQLGGQEPHERERTLVQDLVISIYLKREVFTVREEVQRRLLQDVRKPWVQICTDPEAEIPVWTLSSSIMCSNTLAMEEI